MELAKEWGEIGYYSQNKDVWGFLTKDKETYTRIELLFDVYLDLNENRDEYTAYYKLQEMAQNKSVDEIYTEIKKIFLTLRYWYENFESYHLVGFLISSNSQRITKIYKQISNETKSEATKKLRDLIIIRFPQSK